MDIKKVFIVGAGALGVMYGKYIKEYIGYDNLFFIADDKRIDKYNKNQFYANDELIKFNYVSPENKDNIKADLIIFALKFTSMDDGIKIVKNFVKEDTIFLSVMNGISSEGIIEDNYGSDHVLYCEVHGMDTTKEKNKVYYKNVGVIVFSSKESIINDDVKAVNSLLKSSNLAYENPKDIKHKLWSKFMLNTAVNPASAVFNANYGKIYNDEEVREVIINTMKEVSSIAKEEGVILTDEEIYNWMEIMGSLNKEGLPSLRQDTKNKRKTEIELFCGTIRKLGKKHNIKTPYNDFLYEKVKEIESNY